MTSDPPDVDPEVDEATSPEPPPSSWPGGRARRVIAVGGGRGGSGKALLAVNLAVYLAQLGRNVVLIDADPFGSSLHTMLGIEEPPLVLMQALRERTFELVATSVPGLKLLPTAFDPITQTIKRPRRASVWLGLVDKLDADYLVVNLGASTAPAHLDVFHEADVSLCVTAPEPPYVEATYRFCCALYFRRLRRAFMRDTFKWKIVERAAATLPPSHSPRELVAAIARYDEAVANVAAAALQQLRPGLVVSKTRLRRDLDLGPAMAGLSERYLGIALDYIGYVELDDAVWLTGRRRRPLLIDAPTSKAARNIERVARRLLALMAQQQKRLAAMEPLDAARLNAPMTLYKVLGCDRSATDDEIRRAYKIQREIFREESLPIVWLVDDKRMKDHQARIHEAYDTLLDAVRRRAYDLSTFPGDERALPQPERRPSASEAELAELQAELAREITNETQFSGPLLRKAREAQGIEIQDIANMTKISPFYLRAIEAEDVPALPAPVYVRGFLQQVARALKLDPTQVTKTYLKRVRATRPDYE
jgi:flagellar biosynthesis protein FlhG